MGTILIAERDAIIRCCLCEAIGERGHLVSEADTPLSAARIAAGYAGRIHALVTDDHMPYFDGCMLAQTIRKMYPDLQVLIFSAYHDRRAQFSVCPHDFVLRPSDPEIVASVLDRVIGSGNSSN